MTCIFLFSRHIHGKRVLVVTNTTVAPLYLDKVVNALTVGNPNVTVENVILPDGEKYKDMVGILILEAYFLHYIRGGNFDQLTYEWNNIIQPVYLLSTHFGTDTCIHGGLRSKMN